LRVNLPFPDDRYHARLGSGGQTGDPFSAAFPFFFDPDLVLIIS